MAGEQWTTVALLKSKLYLDISVTDYDTDLDQLITDVTAGMIDVIDDEDFDTADPGDVLERACAVQCAYEWKRRKDTGLTSVTFQDGTINKFNVDEFLPSVKSALDRAKYIPI